MSLFGLNIPIYVVSLPTSAGHHACVNALRIPMKVETTNLSESKPAHVQQLVLTYTPMKYELNTYYTPFLYKTRTPCCHAGFNTDISYFCLIQINSTK